MKSTRRGTEAGSHTLGNAAGLRVEMLANGALRRIDGAGVCFNLFIGNGVEGGPTNLWLRLLQVGGVEGQARAAVPLLGPQSPLQWRAAHTQSCEMRGHWRGLRLRLQLRLAPDQLQWFWHLQVHNTNRDAVRLDALLAHDVGLSEYGALRQNEHYVSQYIDLTPLQHPRLGWVLAARQNLAVGGRNPWAIAGSLRRAVAHATDSLQFNGTAARSGADLLGVQHGLPGVRQQQEHALMALQDAPLTLAPGARGDFGFFVSLQPDHPLATGPDDLAAVDAAVASAQAQPPATLASNRPLRRPMRTLFTSAPWLAVDELSEADLDAGFGMARRHCEREDGELLSFFHGVAGHVVLPGKELRVRRPHGHILRSGAHQVPDEAGLTSTAWMAGVFHSMVTQGHVSINRFLGTGRGFLGQFRSTGLRAFVEIGGVWRQLGVPAAFEIETHGCRWLYRHAAGLIEVRSSAGIDAHVLSLQVRVLEGAPLRLLLSHHVALAGDDGSAAVVPQWQRRGEAVVVAVPAGSELAARFPQGAFCIEPIDGTRFDAVGGDEMLWSDGRSRAQPFLCIRSAAVTQFGLRLRGELVRNEAVESSSSVALPLALPQVDVPQASALHLEATQLAEALPWFLQNALVHYLSPRGLEQFSGGGWGTRDVCQGPLELLLALGRTAPVRDLLCRVFAAQNADGDWPQWFMFFDRERDIRAGDSHGDIVFWPLLGLARYLLASGDAALLDSALPFYAAPGAAAEVATLARHVERALALIRGRRIAGTHLAAYGHGDWNDSLQPADPALREHLCSAWTVTLHRQTLDTLGQALQACGRTGEGASLRAEALQVQADFLRLLVSDGVVAGYVLFPPDATPQMLLHPRDERTGLQYSLLPMMHAVLADMLTPEQAQAHLALIDEHLVGPDGARLFDRPLAYRGGPQTLFQRAESSAFFGREIGVMYMHAHLRYAEMLAHLGLADRFFRALTLAHPVALRERVPSASLRQANCYYSSSDADFADRYEASRDYGRIADGSVALDGGWRVYSSGPGIALGMIVNRLFGLRQEAAALHVDPVLPAALDGLTARIELAGRPVQVFYRVAAVGCGVQRIELNGQPLPFTRAPNPYRVGAAVVDRAVFVAALLGDGAAQQGADRLVIEIA